VALVPLLVLTLFFNISISITGYSDDLKAYPATYAFLKNASDRLVGVGTSWLMKDALSITGVAPPNGLEDTGGVPFFWLGNQDAAIEVVSKDTGYMRLRVTISLGPSLPGATLQRLVVRTGESRAQVLTVGNQELSVVVPVHRGHNAIFLHVADTPTITLSDPRVLLLRVLGWRASMITNELRLLSVSNPNGTEGPPDDPFYWLQNEPTRVDVFSPGRGFVRLTGILNIGPSLPGKSSIGLEVVVNDRVTENFQVGTAPLNIEVPVDEGDNQISIRVTDTRTVPAPAGGDTRPLLAVLRNLSIAPIVRE
jgi:hypothetical protein